MPPINGEGKKIESGAPSLIAEREREGERGGKPDYLGGEEKKGWGSASQGLRHKKARLFHRKRKKKKKGGNHHHLESRRKKDRGAGGGGASGKERKGREGLSPLASGKEKMTAPSRVCRKGEVTQF